jgi:hypothetical protein
MSTPILTRSGQPFGGPICATALPKELLAGDGRELTTDERSALWRLFQEIGRCWKNVRRDSINLKSSWLEFIEAKTMRPPSYTAEYANAVEVVSELVAMHGEKEAYSRLFLDFQAGPEPLTRLAHAKIYVVDEFIHVQVVAAGFRGFGGKKHAKNYNGFIRGSRYNRLERVRSFQPGSSSP